MLEDLQNHPPYPPAINWQKFAREHEVPGENRGQVIKDFAQCSGIDTFQLDGRKSERQRKKKRQLIGGEISAPITPTPSFIKERWKQMVETGELSLGIPCAASTFIHYTTTNGQVQRKEVIVTGRKFPLKEEKNCCRNMKNS